MSAPIFVVGAPRSGTTLMRRYLNAHPDVHLTFEASFFALRRTFPSDWSPKRRRAFLENSLGMAWQRIPADVVPSLFPQTWDGSSPAPFEAQMRYCAERAGARVWGDKSPVHTQHIGAILAAWPNARVIHIVRDPVAVCASLFTVPWANPNLFSNAMGVRYALNAVEPFRDRIHEVRLEDLLADPEPALRGALDFCGLDWHPALLSALSQTADDAPPLPWLVTTSAERNRVRPRSKVPDVDLDRIARLTRPQRARYGYSPVPRLSRTLGGHLLRAWIDILELTQAGRYLWGLKSLLRQDPTPAPLVRFDAYNRFHAGASLACLPEERAALETWLSQPHGSATTDGPT